MHRSLPRAGRRAAASALACLGLVSLLVACSNGSGPEPPLNGTYTMRTIGGLAPPATYGCGTNVSSGTLTIVPDSAMLRVTTGQGSDTATMAWRRSYVRSADGSQLVVSYEQGSQLRDTITVRGGGRVTDRVWLPVSAACAASSAVQVDLGFTHD